MSAENKNLQRRRLTRQSFQQHPRDRLMASLKKPPLPQHLPKPTGPSVQTARNVATVIEDNVILPPVDREVTVMVPQGVGDIFWVYQKLSPYFDRINLEIATIEHSVVQLRSKDWVKLFPKVGKVSFPIVGGHHYNKLTTFRPRLNDLLRDYQNGRRNFDFSCNNFLETGTRLEKIDPNLPPEWNVKVKTEEFELPWINYIVLYVSGSNKTTLHWPDSKWIEFTLDFYKKYDLKYPIIMIGASYDKDTVEEMSEEIKKSGIDVATYIDLTPAKVCHIIKNSLYFIGYQSGLSILADNFNVPQFMIYFPYLKKMLFTWAVKENIDSGIFRAVTFDQPYEEILATLPDNFPQRKINFLVPQGIGDSIWTLVKLEDATKKLGGKKIGVCISCVDKDNKIEQRAIDFISRFSFVDSVKMYEVPQLGQQGAALTPGPAVDENGLFRYLPDGKELVEKFEGIDYITMPNAALERGIRLEDWLPEFESNWKVMDSFQFTEEEKIEAEDLKNPYAVFYCSSLQSNTIAGHNKDSIWKPEDWIKLGSLIQKKWGLEIVVVGADYDRSYYEENIVPLLEKPWTNKIGDYSIGTTLSITKKAKFVISYQSGIGIASSYMGTPVAIFWREKGNSISPHDYVSFEEEMASAWVPPEMIKSGKHLPLIYGKHDVDYIIENIEKLKWN